MPALVNSICDNCRALEEAHDAEMDAYIHLVEQQSSMFRIGHVQAGRDLDIAILAAKTRRQSAVDALLAHQAARHPQPSPRSAVSSQRRIYR